MLIQAVGLFFPPDDFYSPNDQLMIPGPTRQNLIHNQDSFIPPFSFHSSSISCIAFWWGFFFFLVFNQ